ncbi:hypothetical protein BCR42DRAFT_386219 [Absidia repens]|uniref:BIR-domain-containing protein n=1 Tax=Absidia repens TaxID=90262 RepID=A0A1X2J1E6_9FUNG|nr:hypothetical protein BCR42DRAFT_386219 [Absidia repens]
MHIYTNRLKTYFQHRHPWPYINNTRYETPEQFAKAGFYNISTCRTKDRVQCYMCDLILDNWKPDQSPMERHSHGSTSCPNVVLNYPEGCTINSSAEIYSMAELDSELMASARLRTFTKNNVWPPSLHGGKKRRTRSVTKQQVYPLASEMAEAGFIFVPTQEKPDLSKCSYCGFYLYELGGNPDIWTQHRNQAPQCLFVQRYQAKANSFEHTITQEHYLSSERKKGAFGDILSSPKTVTESTVNTNPPTVVNGKHGKDEDEDGDAGDGVGTRSTFDDSIWDIASVQLKDTHHNLKAKQGRSTNTAPRITYSGKKRKRSAKILSTGPSNQASVLSPLNQSTNGSFKNQSKPKNQATAMEHDLTNPMDTSTPSKKPKETVVQLFARLQKRPNMSYTSEEKGKGRAIDLSRPLSTPTKESTSSTSKRLTKDSLRLSTRKKNLKASPVADTTKTIASSSSTSSSMTATSLNHQHLVQQV